MFRLLYRKQHRIEKMVGGYLDLWETCLGRFHEALRTYLASGLGEDFDFLVERTHKAESQADDQRRAIERHMYAEGLLPESRGDILGFLEAMDHVPGVAQATLYMIATQRIERPPALAAELATMVEVTAESTDLLLTMSRGIFHRRDDLFDSVKRIDERESRCDHIERTLIERIFDSAETGDFRKLQLRDLVIKLGDISDSALEVGDRIVIMSLKRRV
jgi:predicted phosphate transport protein (TIGR00153 family)